jgi:DNA-binding MurR/RpiR family transcriptional regulator
MKTSAQPARQDLLQRLQSVFDRYPTALVRAAQYILENPEKVIHQSLAELSMYSETGQASIVRLCQELGFEGYTQFKIALAADVALRGVSGAPQGPTEPLDQITDLLCDSIRRTRDLIEPQELDRAAAGLAQAMRIDLFGSGVSGMIADLFAYRLLRLGRHANSMRDAVLAHEISNGLGPGTAAIAVSQSGETPDTVKFLKFARDAGAFTLAITCHAKSPLAKAADATLRMARLKEPTYGGPISDVPRAILIAEALAVALARFESRKKKG